MVEPSVVGGNSISGRVVEGPHGSVVVLVPSGTSTVELVTQSVEGGTVVGPDDSGGLVVTGNVVSTADVDSLGAELVVVGSRRVVLDSPGTIDEVVLLRRVVAPLPVDDVSTTVVSGSTAVVEVGSVGTTGSELSSAGSSRVGPAISSTYPVDELDSPLPAGLERLTWSERACMA